jgi:integrase/recombinase XerC
MTPFFLHKFLEYLKVEKRYSEHTSLAYAFDLGQFIDFLDLKDEKDYREINSFSIRSWLVNLLDKNYSKKTVNRKLSTLRSFLKWLKKEGVISDNTALRVHGPKTEKRIPVFARVSDLSQNKLDNFCDKDFKGMQKKLVIEVLYQTGIRLSELVNLKVSDIDQDRIKVIGKRNKERIIPISYSLFSLIEEFKLELIALKIESPFLFTLKNGNKIYPKFVYRIINSYLGLVTDLDKCSPHVLRHTFATHMLNNGAGLEVLKDLLGHSSLAATQVYTHSSFSGLQNIYSQAHPRGHKKK